MERARIEEAATRLLRDMWRERKRLAPRSSDPIDLLEPELAARYLGIRFEEHAGLGRFGHRGEQFEVAGFMDRKAGKIAVSKQFPADVTRFTAAHEIGHWLLHPREFVHRDRPLKGLSPMGQGRHQHEAEADYFAACFLMPRKILVKEFRARFQTAPLIINDDSAFWLSPQDPELMMEQDSFDRAATVATARSYATRPFQSLTARFRVSLTSMAIRLQELDLIHA